MPKQALDPRADWNRQRPDVRTALETLLRQIADGTSDQNILDSYLYAKAILADAMESLAKAMFDGTSPAFHKLRKELQAEVEIRYRGVDIPARFLKLPYGGPKYERLFALLLNFNGAVPSSLIRAIEGDSVHTERRVRELRELGLNIVTRKEGGQDVYELSDLTLDTSVISKIVANNIVSLGRKSLSKQEKERLISLAHSIN
jgi:hypothetical protein